MTFLEEGQGLCQRSSLDKKAPRLWEDRLPKEKLPEREMRHARARILCNRCPALEECEAVLRQSEAKGQRIDGVVAGRFSTVKVHYDSDTQTHCAGCGHWLELASVSGSPRRFKQKPGAIRHAGEGLCVECYPKLRRRKKSE